MKVMNRFECINIVNKLREYNLITDKQQKSIISKRDKQEEK